MQRKVIFTVFHENVSLGSEIVKTRFQTKASKQGQPQGSHFNREKGRIGHVFLLSKHFLGQKSEKGAKKFFEVNFLLLLHKLPNWSFGSSLFVYLKGILNFGFY